MIISSRCDVVRKSEIFAVVSSLRFLLVLGKDTRTSACPLLRAHRAGRRANLLVVRGHGRDLLVVELLGDGSHQVRAVLAETALPHVQCERDILCVLSGKVRHWRHALTVRSMTIVTAQDAFGGVAFLRK